MDVTVNNEGMVILAGIYQLFPLKNIWFWLLAGCASVLSYLITAKKKTLKGAIGFFFIGLFVVFVIGGAIRDIFGKGIPDWGYTLLGFFAYPILKKLIENTDRIVSALYKKIFDKLGIELKEEKRDDTESSN